MLFTFGCKVKKREGRLYSMTPENNGWMCMSIWVPGSFTFTNKVSTCSIVVKLRDLGWGKELNFLGEEGIETMSKLPVVRQSTKLTEGGEYDPYSRISLCADRRGMS